VLEWIVQSGTVNGEQRRGQKPKRCSERSASSAPGKITSYIMRLEEENIGMI